MADNRCEDCGHYNGCFLECKFDLDHDMPSIYVCRCLEEKEAITAFEWPFALTSVEVYAWAHISDRMRRHLAYLIKESEPYRAQIDQRKTYKHGSEDVS